MRLNGRIALITGAASGIGQASAHLFAQEGAKVVVADVDDVGGKDTVANIKDSGGEAIFVHVDISVPCEVENLINKTIETFGKIDILFNNAGIGDPSTEIEDFPESLWDRIYAVNVKGMFLTIKYAVPYMKKAGHGVIINTGSIADFKPRQFMFAYASSKGAIRALTISLALDLAASNIRVNCINPGPVDTPFLKKFSLAGVSYEERLKTMADQMLERRLAKPEDIAYVALYLASDESSMVTGTSITIDGGYVIKR